MSHKRTLEFKLRLLLICFLQAEIGQALDHLTQSNPGKSNLDVNANAEIKAARTSEPEPYQRPASSDVVGCQ